MVTDIRVIGLWSWPKNNHIPTAIDQFSMISFSEKWLSKILQNKIFFPHIKFFNFFWNRWSSVELGGAQRSSAEIGGARQSSVEFGGVRRSSVELSRAQRSLVELGGARRSSVALPSVPPPQPTSLLLRFQKMRWPPPPPPHCRLYKASAKPNKSRRPAKRLCFLRVH